MQTLNANEYIARGFDTFRPVMAAFVCREQVKALSYRIYQICDRKGLTDEALAYNNLVAMWGALAGKVKDVRKRQPVQGELGM